MLRERLALRRYYAVVGKYHQKAMPVILTNRSELKMALLENFAKAAITKGTERTMVISAVEFETVRGEAFFVSVLLEGMLQLLVKQGAIARTDVVDLIDNCVAITKSVRGRDGKAEYLDHAQLRFAELRMSISVE